MRLTHHLVARTTRTWCGRRSNDGVRWVSTGVWTLPARNALKIGPLSLNTAGAVGRFDYVHT
ncbi:hypothetical protein ACIQOF_35885 [Streptomyces sp. NPDC091265]|uniref:hypothetical protein n=1 Tax=unclassified Streptomyces TaxID=2593676 RepID=UPI00344C755A